MSEQRLIDANALIEQLKSIINDYTSNGAFPNGYDINSAIDSLSDALTIDLETLSIVQGLRAQLDAIKEAYNVAGHRPLLTQAIERFGQDAQERMMFEEMSELQKAICKMSRGKGCIDDIAQEIADVEIMLEQMKILYQCEESTTLWKHEKLERLKSLLNEGRDE